MPAHVVSFKIVRRELTSDDVPDLKTIFHISKLPLAPSYIELELKDVPTALVNAMRRVITDELMSHTLQVPDGGFSTALTTDKFMLPQFVNSRIARLRLCRYLSDSVVKNLKLDLDVMNPTADVLSVYAGDFRVAAGTLSEPIFNPTARIAVLQPGKRIVIKGIHISAGIGTSDASYNVACNAAFTHLDIPQYSDEEMRDPKGIAVDWSGYKVSCMVANPRHHRLTATLPATSPNPSEVRAVIADVCDNIKGRLTTIADAIALKPAESILRGIQYAVIELDGDIYEGILQIMNESHTIGELLRRYLFDLDPTITNVSYKITTHGIRKLELSIRCTFKEITSFILRAIAIIVDVLDKIQSEI